MTAEEEYLAKQDELRKIVEKEKTETYINNISPPSLIEKVLKFDYSMIDSLGVRDLEKHMGALSQYLVYINKYINQVKIAQISADDEHRRVLNIAILAVDKVKYKTVSEKEMEAEQDEQVKALKKHLSILNSRLAVHKNIPESINNLIQTVKKVYDAKIREGFTPNE